MIVLDKFDVLTNRFVESLLIKALQEESSRIAEDLGSMIRTSAIVVGVTFMSEPLRQAND